MTGTCRLNFWRPSITIELINIKHRMQKDRNIYFGVTLATLIFLMSIFKYKRNNENTIFIEKIRKAQQ